MCPIFKVEMSHSAGSSLLQEKTFQPLSSLKYIIYCQRNIT